MIVLGFVALLKQKTYLDRKSGQTTIEVPLAGKMTTNFPALVFVFLGFVLALYEGKKAPVAENPATWTLRGSFHAPSHTNFTWSAGILELIPTGTHVNMSTKGEFEMTAQAAAGKPIENLVKALVYTHELGGYQFDLQEEVRNYNARTNSLIQSLDRKTCTILFKPVNLNFLDE